MAPADMPTVASASYSDYNGSYHASGSNSLAKVIVNGTTPSSTFQVASTSSNPATVLSQPFTESQIIDGRADGYDNVRQLLCAQPPWPDQNEKVIALTFHDI